jgi:citrate synthase
MCGIDAPSSILINVINMSAWISRDNALRLLGLKPQTLYAYVSRRLIAAHPDPADPRRSLYSLADAERLVARRARGRRAAMVAERAISWGEAVLPTAISTVAGGRLFYRGRDAVALASHASLEDAAALLWNVPEFPRSSQMLPVRPELPPVEAALSMLAATAHHSDPTQGRARASLAAEAAALLRRLAAALGADLADGISIAAGFARRWNCGAHAGEAIRAALVLTADHELNASTFAARVAASTGAPLAAAALAGLATLLGPAHGGATLRVRTLVEDAERKGAKACVQQQLARGGALAGFGHPLYPDIDPRAAALLERIPVPGAAADLMKEGFAATGLRANIDFATVAMALGYRLPSDAPFRLFAAARAAGWLAHAIEQAESGRLIRPRARYTGPPLDAA